MFKVVKEGRYKTPTDKASAEEFNIRVENLRSCVGHYNSINPVKHFLKKDLERININETCGKHLNMLKDFINNTGAYYQNVYTPK